MSDIFWIKLKTSTFQDEKVKLIESLPDGHTHLITWLKLLCLAGKSNAKGRIFFNKKTSFSEQMLATVFNQSVQTLKKSLEILSEFGLINKSKKGVITVKNWEKHQNVDEMERLKEQNRRRQSRYRDKKKSNVTVTQPITLSNGTELELDIELDKYSQESNEYRLSQILYNQIKKRNPKQKEPKLQDWSQSIDYLIRLDNRTPEEIEKVILWSQQDDFWKNNILSTSNLRKNFDQLYLKMNDSKSVTDSLPQLTNEEEGWK